MKKLITFTSLLSCFCVMLLSCSSIITHRNPNVETSTIAQTSPSTTVVTTIITLPPWGTQTGSQVIETHSGNILTNIRERTLTDKEGNPIMTAKIFSPEVDFYDNESLQNTVNYNLLNVLNEIEHTVDSICARYVDADSKSFLAQPYVWVDYSLEYYTKDAMSLKFCITETDNNAQTNLSYVTYNLDLTTGSVISCSAMFKDADLGKISQQVSQKLTENGYTLFPNSQKLIEDHLPNRWFMELGKFNLCFNPGEIAAISQGCVELSLDVEEITPLLSQYGQALFTVKYEDN